MAEGWGVGVAPGPRRGLRHRVPLQLAHEGDQGGLLPRRQLYAQDEVEELGYPLKAGHLMTSMT